MVSTLCPHCGAALFGVKVTAYAEVALDRDDNVVLATESDNPHWYVYCGSGHVLTTDPFVEPLEAVHVAS